MFIVNKSVSLGKNTGVILLLCLLFIHPIQPTKGLNQSLTTFVFHIGAHEVMVNQESWMMDVTPELKDHRTFIPLRFLVEKMGASVQWKENPDFIGEGAIVIGFHHESGYQKRIILHTNYKTVFVETTLSKEVEPTIQTLELDVAPYIKIPNNRTLVPIRFITESVGATVSWEEASQKITVEWNGFFPPGKINRVFMKSLPLPKIEWSKQIMSETIQRGKHIQSTVDSGYILCTNEELSNDTLGIRLLKLFSDGSIEWSKQINKQKGLSTGVFVNQTADNGYFIIGNYENPSESVQCDIVLYRLNQIGEILWEKTIGAEKEDRVLSVRQTADRGYILTGYSDSFTNQKTDILFIKIDESGNVVWQQVFGKNGYEMGTDCLETADGNLLLSGAIQNSQGHQQILLIKTDSKGEVLWQKNFGSQGNYYINAMIEANDQGYVLMGETDAYSEEEGIYLLKTDTFGKMLWEKYYEKIGSTIGHSIAKTNSGGFMIAGITNVSIDDLLSESGNADGYLLFTDSYGNKIWDLVTGGQNHDSLSFITRSSDLGFIICGKSSSNEEGRIAIWLVKVYPIKEDEALLDVNPESISFGLIEKNSSKITTLLTVSNLGSQNLKGYLSFPQSWILLSDQNFIIPGFSSLKVLVSLLPNKLEEGYAEDFLQITSNGGNKRIRVYCTIVDNSPKLWVYPTEITFGTIRNRNRLQQTFSIANFGRKNLIGSVQSTVSWLLVHPTEIQHNDTEITVELRPSILRNGEYKGIIDISSNGGKQSVIVYVRCEFPLIHIEFCVNQPDVIVNQKKAKFDKDNPEIVPFIMEGRTLVPFRFIGEAFGATLEWESNTKQIHLELVSKEIQMTLTVNQKEAILNHETIKMDVPPLIYKNRVFVPIRFIAESFGATVQASRNAEGKTCITIDCEE